MVKNSCAGGARALITLLAALIIIVLFVCFFSVVVVILFKHVQNKDPVQIHRVHVCTHWVMHLNDSHVIFD